MSVRDIRHGINAIRAGNLQEGARLIKVGLKDEDIPPRIRAVALTWLAETKDDIESKIDYYQQAAQADPTNPDIAERLGDHLRPPARSRNDSRRDNTLDDTQVARNPQDTEPTRPAEPPQSPRRGWPASDASRNQVHPDASPWQDTQTRHTQPDDTSPQPITMQQAPAAPGIYGGPNGRGTGIVVTRDGLIATTRYITGGMMQLTVALQDGRRIPGEVVRSFPQYDLALLKAPLQVDTLLPVTQTQTVPDNASIMAVAHPDQNLRGSRRATRHRTESHWFPTTFNYLLDAGGNPVFTLSDRLLTGLLTRNLSRSSGHFYALHIGQVYQCVQQYIQEARQAVVQTLYCTSCGSLSRAPSQNAYYCEFCGSTHDYALGMRRHPQDHLLRFYGEGAQSPCPNCDSRAGIYDGECLRCGYYL